MNDCFAGKKVVCFCDTPFQVIGLIALFSDSRNRGFKSCDVLIDSAFPDSSGVAERLSKEGIFSSVSCGLQRVESEYAHLGSRWLAERSFREAIKDDLLQSFPHLDGSLFDVLVCSSAIPQTLALKHFFVPKGYSIFFDDGCGSHNGNVFKPFFFQDNVLSSGLFASGISGKVKGLSKRIVKCIPFLDYRFNIKELWLFSPTDEERQLYKNIDILSLSVPDDCELLRRVLSPSLDETLYQNKKYILLTNSRTAPDHVRKLEVDLAKYLYELLGEKLGIKIHPNRDIEDFSFCDDVLLPANDSWELLLFLRIIDENNVLLGYGSSAQIHPKTFCDVEPTVVFFFNFLNCEKDETSIAFEQSARCLHNAYKGKERILYPKGYDELDALLQINS